MSGTYFFDRRLAKGEPSSYVVDKEKSCDTFINYMNIRLQKMFHYEGLPDTIPKEMLEYYLLNNGTCFVTEVDGKLYAFCGSFGGQPDPYYRPTTYVIANPALNFSKQCNLETDGILVRNDTLWVGLYPLMARYATLMAENMLTIRTADIMLRIMALLSAPDDRSKAAADEYLKKLEKGELAAIGENRFFDDGIKMQSPPSNNGSYLTQFIELHQYLTGTFYNEVGLNANFNMKRESIGEGESSLNEDSLLPLTDEMLRCRKEDVEKINKKYGTNITVEFDSSWANNRKEIDLSIKVLEKEASQLAEDITGTEFDTNEHNDSSIDEESERGDSGNEDGGDTGVDNETDPNSGGSADDSELLVDEHENDEEEDDDGRNSKD